MTDLPYNAEPVETRGESVVLTLRTTRTVRMALDDLRGPLTRSCFAARALKFTLDCLERKEPGALEQFASPSVNDHFRGGKRYAKTPPMRPPTEHRGRTGIVASDPTTTSIRRVGEGR